MRLRTVARYHNPRRLRRRPAPSHRTSDLTGGSRLTNFSPRPKQSSGMAEPFKPVRSSGRSPTSLGGLMADFQGPREPNVTQVT